MLQAFMKSNLENISFNNVVSADGSNYAIFRTTLNASYKKAIMDIAKGYACLVAIFVVSVLLIKTNLFPAIIAIPVCALLIGYTLAYLHLFIHAAAHYNLHPNKKKNDLISDYFIGMFFGIQQKKYRKIHWMHHTNLGTQNDTEHTYFNQLNTLFIIKCITGIYPFAVILGRKKNIKAMSEKGFFSWTFWIYSFLFHTILLYLFFIAGWELLVAWLGGLVIFFPFLAALRQLLEHRDTDASAEVNYTKEEHGKVSRLFGRGIIDSSFGAAGFNRHLLHHWDPTISYTSLASVEDYLLKCPETAGIIKESKTSYLKTFWSLFKF